MPKGYDYSDTLPLDAEPSNGQAIPENGVVEEPGLISAPKPAVSGYEGIPDNQLAWYQKLEKGYEQIDPRVKGHELFSPGAMEAKAGLVAPIAGAGLIGAAAMNPAARGLILKYGPKAAGLLGAGKLMGHFMGGHGE